MAVEIKSDISFGLYKPAEVWDNVHIASWGVVAQKGTKTVHVTKEYLDNIGVLKRYIAGDEDTVIEMGRKAALGVPQGDRRVDAIYAISSQPVGSLLAEEIALGLNLPRGIFKRDVYAACSGFVRALDDIKQNEQEYLGKDIWLVATEKYRPILCNIQDEEERKLDPSLAGVLFSDGAAALRIRYGENFYIHAAKSLLLPKELREAITMPFDRSLLPQEGSYIEEPVPVSKSGKFQQNGPEVLRAVFTYVPPLIDEVVEQAGLLPKDIKLVIPHQGSGPIVVGLAKKIPEYQVFRDFSEGNFSSASIPKALMRALGEGIIRKGDRIVLAGFGVGLFSSAAVVEV